MNEFKYYLMKLTYSDSLYRQHSNEYGEHWFHWSFSQTDWVFDDPREHPGPKNELVEITAAAARAYVQAGYEKRAQSYAKQAVCIDLKAQAN